MSKELLSAFQILEEEKGISKDIIKEALEAALVSAYKRNYGTSQNVEVKYDDKTGEIKVYQVKEVSEEVYDSQLEISLSQAREKNRAYEVGDKIKFEVTPSNFGRIAAQTAKQVIMQRMREAERTIIYDEYIQYKDDLMTGTVERQDNRFIYVNLGKVEAVLSKNDQIENENFQAHDRIKVYVSNVEDSAKGPQVFVSRTHPNLIKRLFEQEVPEIYEGIVEITSIAREPGDRAKVAVRSHDDNIDPVGTCVGPRGARVQSIVNELNGENMDIVEWDENPEVFIKSALNPAEVLEVRFTPGENSCLVIVPDYQLSLAIGKRGQNVRLAAKLTGYKIDIKSEDKVDESIYEDTIPAEDAFMEQFEDEDSVIAYRESLEETNNDMEEAQLQDEIDVDALASEVEEMEESAAADETIDDVNFEHGEYEPEDAEDMIEFSKNSKENIFSEDSEDNDEMF